MGNLKNCTTDNSTDMKIILVHQSVLPVKLYGGTERIVWWIARELHNRAHEVSLLLPKGSSCPFAKVIELNPSQPIGEQIPESADLVHFHYKVENLDISKPYLVTIHGNGQLNETFDINSVFVSENHAKRHGATAFVYNGVDFSEYGDPALKFDRNHLHFLAKAAWKIKNVKGAIRIARQSKHELDVIGGNRLNLKMGFRFTPYPTIHFHGMKGGEEKNSLLRSSKALLFPVLWHEPFGISVIESMYFGCAVYGTPWGSLPELVIPEVGFLSGKYSELSDHLKNYFSFDRNKIHQYACDNFSAKKMVDNYLNLYEKMLQGKSLNIHKPKVTNLHPADYFTMSN